MLGSRRPLYDPPRRRRVIKRSNFRPSLNRDFLDPRRGWSSFNFQIDPDLNQKKKVE